MSENANAIRDAILAELERRGWTKYRLIQEIRIQTGHDCRDMVYRYLSGKRDMYTVTLQYLFKALGMLG